MNAVVPRRSRHPFRAAVCVLIGAVAFATESGAHAEVGPSKRIVVYVEVTSGDPAVVRSRLRDSIPASVLPADALDYRAALAPKKALKASLSTPKERAALFLRMRDAAREIHADGVLAVLMTEAAKRRSARVIFLATTEEKPVLDEVVALEAATAKSDAARLKSVVGPALQRFAASSEVAAPPAIETPAAEPPAAPPPAPVPPSPAEVTPPESREAPPREAPAPSRPPITASVALDLFPAGVVPSFATAKVALPLSSGVALVPRLGVGYLPVPADDVGTVFGGAVRFTFGRNFTIEPSGLYARFAKFVLWYQGSLRIAMAFGGAPNRPRTVSLAVTPSVSRWLWRTELGAPGAEVIEGYGELEAQIRPAGGLRLSPIAGYFVYDRSLVGSKPAINAVALNLAPYPIQGFFGASVGYELGHWTPYATARQFFYSAGIGSGTFVGPGLRFAYGPDFVDARVGLFINATRGPLSLPVLDSVPAVNLEMGWAL